MLENVSLGLLWFYVVFIGISWFVLWVFVRQNGRRRTVVEEVEEAPQVAVLLSLRGKDPWLEACLEGMARQVYRPFQLVVILDSPEDPAMAVIQKFRKQFPECPTEIQILQEHLTTCSLKCNSLIQAVNSLDASFEIVAFLDSDIIPHPHWLEELVRPFQDSQVDFTTGYRWFLPASGSCGSWVRYIWNVASYVHVYLHGILWGGSCAVRREVLERLNLAEAWKTALSDDVVMTEKARRERCRIAWVPADLMVSQEACTLAFAYRWCSRQMLMIRLYSPVIWRRMMGMTLFVVLAQSLSFFLIYQAWRYQNTTAWWGAWGGLLFFWGMSLGMLLVLEKTARKNVQMYQKVDSWYGFFSLFRLVWAVPLTIFSFSLGIFQAYFARTIQWRGIRYRIFSGKPVSIERLNYTPFSLKVLPTENSEETKGAVQTESLW